MPPKLHQSSAQAGTGEDHASPPGWRDPPLIFGRGRPVGADPAEARMQEIRKLTARLQQEEAFLAASGNLPTTVCTSCGDIGQGAFCATCGARLSINHDHMRLGQYQQRMQQLREKILGM